MTAVVCTCSYIYSFIVTCLRNGATWKLLRQQSPRNYKDTSKNKEAHAEVWYLSVGLSFQTQNFSKYISGTLFKYRYVTLKKGNFLVKCNLEMEHCLFMKIRNVFGKLNIFYRVKNKHHLTAWGFKWTLYQGAEKLLFYVTSWKLPGKDDFRLSGLSIYADMCHSETLLACSPHNMAFYDKSLLCYMELL